MKIILRQIIVTAFYISLPFLLTLGVSFLYFPPSSYGVIIDTGNRKQSIFRSSVGRIILGIDKLKITEKPKIIFSGSSNVREGFRPPDSTILFPDHESHNLSIGASNITQIIDIVSYAGNSLPRELSRQTVFVVGIWYGNFVANGDRYRAGSTDFENEMTRTKIYRKVLFGFKKVNSAVSLGDISHNIRMSLIRPFLLLGKVRLYLSTEFVPFSSKNIKRVINLMAGYLLNFEVFSKNNEFNVKETAGAVRFQNWYMRSDDGFLKEEQFLELVNLGHVVTSFGSRLILVDLPLADWHSATSKHFERYQKEKVEYINRMLLSKNIEYINLQNTLDDDDFDDLAHPKRTSTLKLMQHFKIKAHLPPLSSSNLN
jgi:hypothetical protein